jgi:23S rRNA pseudouridine1911/1915/1917 synthase
MPESGGPIQQRPRRPRPEAEAIDLAVIYEDNAVVAVDKPPGMVVHPTYKNWSGTLLNGLLARFREPRIVTRLDRDTSGLVLVALGADMHARMQRDSIAGRMKKEYLAIVRGTPEPASGSIVAPLARSAEDRRRVVVDPAGQESQTDYEVLSAINGFALVRCRLMTGRTHQIRVHLAANGHPVVGDVVYGTPEEGLTRQALHAWRVAFPHPATRAPVELESSLPADLQQFLRSQNFRL